MKKKITKTTNLKLYFIVALFGLLTGKTLAQTNPGSVFDLSTGSWALTGWSSSVTTGLYPTNGATGSDNTTGVSSSSTTSNMRFWKHGSGDPLIATAASADYTGSYTSANGTVYGNGTNGIGFNNTGGAGIGSAVLSVNTTNRQTIQITWTGRTLATGARTYGIRLMYRVGTSGNFVDANGTSSNIFYPAAGSIASTTMPTVTLPAAAENAGTVQILWYYYNEATTTSGTRPTLGLDDITVSSSSSLVPYYWGGTATGTYPSSGFSSWTSGSNVWGTNTTSGATNTWPTSGNYVANFNAATANNITIPTSFSGYVQPGAVNVNAPTTFNTSASTSALTAGIAIASSQLLTTAPVTSTILTLGGIISGSGSLTQNGAGTTILSGANTHSGGTTLSSGQLNINNATALGTGTFTISGGTVDNSSGSSVTNSSNNTQNWNGDFTFTGTNNLNLGTGSVTLSANRQVTVNAGTLTVGGAISGSSISLTKAGSGTLALNTTVSTYTGGTTINAGTISIDGSNRIGTGALAINSGTFQLTTVGLNSGRNISFNNSNSTFDIASGITYTNTTGTFSGSGILNKTSAGNLVFQSGNSNAQTYNGLSITAGSVTVNKETDLGTVPASTNASYITLGGGSLVFGSGFAVNNKRGITLTGSTSNTISTATATNDTISSIITGSGNITFYDTATSSNLFLTGANTYTGTTTVSGNGNLYINGSTSSSSAVTVSSGAGLGGNGTINGSTTISSGGYITGGQFGSIGTLNTGAVSISNGGAYYQVDMNNTTGSAGTINDLLNVTGNLSFGTGCQIILVGTLSNFTNTNTYTWTIATVSGTISGTSNVSISTVSLTNPLIGGSNSFSLSVSGNNLILTYQPSAVTRTWSTNNSCAGLTAANWSNSITPGSFSTNTNTDLAQFSTNSVSNGAIGINMNTSPYIYYMGGIELTSSYPSSSDFTIAQSSGTARSYFLQLNGTIINGVSNSVIRNASSSTLTLTSPGTSSSNSCISSGLAWSLSLASATSNIISIEGSGGINIGTSITGSGALTKNGSGTGLLTLTTGNTYTGKTFLNAGTISTSGEGAFGANPGSFTADQITFNGGTLSASGAINFSSNRGITFTGTSSAINTNANNVTLTSICTGTGGYTKSGSGTLILAGIHTYTGATTISAGTLQLINAATSYPASSALSIASGTTFDINGFSPTVGSLAGAGTVTSGTSGNLTLTAGGDNTSTTFSGVIQTGSATSVALTKTGTGTLILTGSNTFAGTTTVSNGTLQLNKTGGTTIPATNSCNVIGGTLQISKNQTLADVTLASGTTLTVDAGVTLTITGTLTVNTGATISGSGTIAYSGSGALVYNGSSTKTAGIEWPGNTYSVTVNNGASVILNGNKTIPTNTLSIAGTLDVNTYSFSSTATNLSIAGTIKTANTNGLINSSATGTSFTGYTSGTAFSNYLGVSSIVEFNGSNQVITGSINYVNLTVSGTDTKTPSSATTVSGTLAVSGSAILDGSVSSKLLSGYSTLNMTGTSTFKIGGSSTQPPASSYSLATTSTIQFDGSSNLTIRSGGINYGNVIINNSNATTGSTGISLQSGCSFTVNSGITLKVDQANGLYSTSNAFVKSNSNSINLSGSTINYNGTSQSITTAVTYSNITISNSGTKTASSTFTVNGTFTQTGSAVLGTSSPTYGSGATLAYVDATASQSYSSGLEWPASNSPANVTINLSGTGTTLVAMSNDKTISGALTLTAGRLSIGNNTLTLGGTISGSGFLAGSNTSKVSVTSTGNVGTVYFDQTTDGSILHPTTGTNSLQKLIHSGNGGSVTIGNKLNLFDRLSVGAGATLNTGDALVLRSTADSTAYVDVVGTGGIINGQVTVERYYHKQFRGWRMVTAPVTYNGITISNFNNTVNKNWQDSFGYAANYGTRFSSNVPPNGISGTNGMDDQTNGANLLTYNSNGTGSWNRVTNTKTETMSGSSGSADNKGFFLFIRGDRTVLPSGTQTPNAYVTTTLAAKGKLQTGPQNFTYGGSANVSWIVGNPYAAPIDMSTVGFTNCGSYVYVWDPNLTGITTSSPGAYNVFNMSNWNLAPTGGGSMNKYFQSGQAFLVKPTVTGATISFAESNKAGGHHSSATTKGSNPAADIFNCILYAVQPNGDRTNVDGYRAMFGSYSAGVDDDDAKKVAASIESITLLRDAINLVVEARPDIVTTDSLFVRMSNMVTGSNYEFNFNPINFSQNVTSCMLVDKFLNIETPISLSSNTIIPFTVSSVAGSNAADRFMVVFGTAPLAIKDLQIRGYRKENKVMVEWTTAKEEDMKGYTVEKSATGNSFTTMATATAKNGINNIYTTVDNTPEAVNYYRIKATGNDGTVTYSKIVRVDVSNATAASVKVYPNPIMGNSISLQLNGIAEGKATISIYNALGQLVAAQSITSSGINGSVTVELDKALAAATYQLQLVDAKGNTTTTQMIKK